MEVKEGVVWPSALEEEIHHLKPVLGETYATPGMKGRGLAARRFGKVENRHYKVPDYISLDHIQVGLPWEIKPLRSPICF